MLSATVPTDLLDIDKFFMRRDSQWAYHIQSESLTMVELQF